MEIDTVPPPPQINSLKRNNSSNHKKYIISTTVIGWILTILFWVFFGITCYILFPNIKPTKENFNEYFHRFLIKEKFKKIFISFTIIIYFLYIICELMSPFFRYLINNRKEEVDKIISELFKKRAKIILIINYFFNILYKIIF